MEVPRNNFTRINNY